MSPQTVQAGNPQHHQGEADGQKNIFNAVRPVGVSNTFTLLDGLTYNTYNILRVVLSFSKPRRGEEK